MRKVLILIALLAFSLPLRAQTIARGVIIETGQPILVQMTERPQSVVFVHDTQTVYAPAANGKGARPEGNTTIFGTLTVTSTCYLGNTNAATYTYGPHIRGYSAPAASTAVTILTDVTYIADAGSATAITLPAVTNGRELVIYNSSAFTTTGDVAIAPASKITLDGVGGTWQ